MKESHTVNEAAALLGVSAKTLRKWIKEDEIETTKPGTDKRVRLLTVKQIRVIAGQHALPFDEEDEVSLLPGIRHKPSWATVLARISELEERVSELEAEKRKREERLASYIPQEPHEPHLRPVRSHGGRSTLPEGWVSLDGFCKRNTIPTMTVTKAIASGRLPQPHRGEWKVDRATVKNALDPEMQAAIIAMYGRIAPEDEPEGDV